MAANQLLDQGVGRSRFGACYRHGPVPGFEKATIVSEAALSAANRR